MKISQTAIQGVRIIESTALKDERGAFSRLFCAQELATVLGSRNIVQINQSLTCKVGAIRGLHYQKGPHAEMKFVRCLKGRVFDVVVDLRQDSPTFLQWVALELSPEKRNTFVIPEGCAHGFQVLEANSELLYLHTAYYTPDSEGAVHFSDPKLDVQWPLPSSDLSERDQNHPFLSEQFTGLII
jgi:dTDP-4-dehydrorhamnose 3,5-epimerase